MRKKIFILALSGIAALSLNAQPATPNTPTVPEEFKIWKVPNVTNGLITKELMPARILIQTGKRSSGHQPKIIRNYRPEIFPTPKTILREPKFTLPIWMVITLNASPIIQFTMPR